MFDSKIQTENSIFFQQKEEDDRINYHGLKEEMLNNDRDKLDGFEYCLFVIQMENLGIDIYRHEMPKDPFSFERAEFLFETLPVIFPVLTAGMSSLRDMEKLFALTKHYYPEVSFDNISIEEYSFVPEYLKKRFISWVTGNIRKFSKEAIAALRIYRDDFIDFFSIDGELTHHCDGNAKFYHQIGLPPGEELVCRIDRKFCDCNYTCVGQSFDQYFVLLEKFLETGEVSEAMNLVAQGRLKFSYKEPEITRILDERTIDYIHLIERAEDIPKEFIPIIILKSGIKLLLQFDGIEKIMNISMKI